MVEGLEDDRFALISKTHHALVDGVSGVDLMTTLFDLDARGLGPRQRAALGPREPSPSDAQLAATALQDTLVRSAALPRCALAQASTEPGSTLAGARRGPLARAQPGARTRR